MTRTPQVHEAWQFPGAMTGPNTRVVDGDTLYARLDLGFYVERVTEVRLDGVDTAEIHGVSHESDEYKRGQAHMEFVEQWLDAAHERYDGDWPLVVTTAPQDTGKYGRWIADIRRAHDDHDLREDLADAFGGAVLPD